MQKIKQTCLFNEHLKLGAKVEEFAGYEMPIVYTTIKEEHRAVRETVGMFDVSHMGEFIVKGIDSTRFVDHIFTNSIVEKENGSVTYGMMLYPNGTIVDDLLVYKVHTEEYFLVVNASNIAKDYEREIKKTESFDVNITNDTEENSENAIKRTQAEMKIFELLDIDLSSLEFFHFGNYYFEQYPLLISRTGYTGEDGFEIYADATAIVELWQRLYKGQVVPCGLGARDTLRFEAALPLYGHEISDEITPLEAGLKMFTKLDSDYDFIGKNALLKQAEEGLTRRVVGIELTKTSVPRAGYPVYVKEEVVGFVTTGYLSITVGKPIALAMINKPFNRKDSVVEVKIRDKMIPGFVRDKKFLKKNYKSKGV